ncbi:unnamed protein product [Ilex paraguariensis]|uniref:Protein decapping 5-like n=1 Tax=Ilex paraguariensis TaxID=185542 RepID=A0ABC8R1D8_9AQUA
MENESTNKATSSSADSYIGSFISLTSKYEIRYEGVLYHLNPQDSTIGLKNVRSYGTEGRKKDGPQIAPSDKVFEYILFRGSDIKDLQVKSSPPTQTEEPMHYDPAIIQSHCPAAPPSSSKSVSVGGGSLTEFGSYQKPPALNHRSYPGVLPSHQHGTQVGTWDPSQIPQSTNVPSFAMPKYLQGYDGMASTIPHAPQNSLSSVTTTSPLTVQNPLQTPTVQVSTTTGLRNAPIGVAPVPSLTTSNCVHPNCVPTLIPEQYSTFLTDKTTLFSVKSPLVSHPAVLSANRTTKFSSSSSCQGSLLKQPPTLLTPDHLSQPWSSAIPLTQKPYPDQKHIGALNLAPPSSSSSVSSPAVQEPLLPLPLSSQQSRYTTQFMEEFDFVAMNEKFKKDEIWGYLGKAKQMEKEAAGIEHDAVSQSLGDGEVYGLALKVDSKPAYNKDDFFDTISCNSLARGSRSVHNRFPERMRLDTRTFGSFQQRTHPGHGGYGAGRGDDQYNWRRGYNYSDRGRGGCMHMHM